MNKMTERQIRERIQGLSPDDLERLLTRSCKLLQALVAGDLLKSRVFEMEAFEILEQASVTPTWEGPQPPHGGRAA